MNSIKNLTKVKYPNFSVTFNLEGAVRQLRAVKKGVTTLASETTIGAFAGDIVNSHDITNESTQCTMTRSFGPEVYNTFDPKHNLPSRTWLRSNFGANPKQWPTRWKASSPEQRVAAHASDFGHDLNANSWVITEMP